MGCKIAVPERANSGLSKSRRESSISAGAETWGTSMDTHASSGNVTRDGSEKGISCGAGNTLTNRRSGGTGPSRRVDDNATKEGKVEEPYLTEEMLLDLTERSTRDSGDMLLHWIEQIPKGSTNFDPLESHQASMAALRELQNERKRETKQSPTKRKKGKA